MAGAGNTIATLDEEFESQSNYLINLINWASVLFDKILIEDYYASSLFKLTKKHDWFWNLFETYSPDYISLQDPELNLLIEDSLQQDLEDPAIKSILKKKLPEYYKSKDKTNSLLINITKTLQIAKTLDAAIIPAEHKMDLFQHKFAEVPLFDKENTAFKATQTIFDFQVPFFSIDNLENFNKIRNDKRIHSFRELIAKLDEDNVQGKYEILCELEKQKMELVKELKPNAMGLIKTLVTFPIPFPFNAAIDGASLLNDYDKIRPYSWYFFLIDLNK